MQEQLPSVSDENYELNVELKSWQEEFRNALTSTRELESFFKVKISTQPYKIFIPLSFAQRIKEAGKQSALWKQFIPQDEENNTDGLHDPIGDKVHAKGDGIIHRYTSRILYSPTTICPINCRYCFRKNELQHNEDFLKANLSKLKKYLDSNPQVEEVVLTGGDPLVLSNQKLQLILKSLKELSTVKYVRFHTRTPIILPQRLDLDFLKLLERFQSHFETISLTIHTNHADELSQDLEKIIRPFKQFNLISQSVLLKDINDTPTDLIQLFKKLNQIGIRPYYLHHPDKVMGGMHFYLPIDQGQKIYKSLRQHLPGWMIPHYVIDSPLATGKTLVL